MSDKSKFLQFNNHEIFSNYIDGQFWIAIKPLCEAIGVNYNRQGQNIRTDKILSQLVAEQQLVAGDKKLRKMLCLPERFFFTLTKQKANDFSSKTSGKQTDA